MPQAAGPPVGDAGYGGAGGAHAGPGASVSVASVPGLADCAVD